MKPNSYSAGTKDDSTTTADDMQVSQTIAKPNVSGSAFAVLPDSERYGLSDKNEIVAIFKYESQARIFGARMWGQFYIVKPIVSEHFH
jgi:hypothetical protein